MVTSCNNSGVDEKGVLHLIANCKANFLTKLIRDFFLKYALLWDLKRFFFLSVPPQNY